ncbi:hypothetical protein UFOVP585_6 [uncultured Caudovirales phage]|uniref:Uncharacterized protein n=1 Tax=uncultured Caudovirales phage TaxID=2100421 RepID=A0A6J5N1T2_9CAUD|nr:hypothetical protein UFOVP585_6 [uncultured Caudovirales phage]
MSEYFIGVDVDYGKDYSVTCIARTLRWYEKLWYKLRRKHAPSRKIIQVIEKKL